MSDEEVVEDQDNKTHPTIVTKLFQSGEHCFWINRDLLLVIDISEYLEFNAVSYADGCKLADCEDLYGKFKSKWQQIDKIYKGGT